MFEFIRTHQRLMQFFLLLLIVPSFVLVGISGYKSSGDAGAVANVAGAPVTQQDWDAAQRQQVERYRQVYGAQFDLKMLETAEAKQGALDNLVTERVMDSEVRNGRLTVTEATLLDYYKSNGLTLADGTLDVERYRRFAMSNNLSTEGLDARVRKDMAAQQLSGAVQNTAFAPRALAARISDIGEQQREVQELMIKAADYTSQVKVSDEMVKAYYEKNAAQFAVPEQVRVEFVVLNGDAVESQVTVSDAEVASFYDANKKRFSAGEQRRASHILINAAKDASSAEKAAAKAKAETVLAEVRKNPADFAKIAKAQSQDPISAEQGGDLGVVDTGTGLPTIAKDSILKLKQGEISDLVQSDFGFHIITVTSIKPAALKPLDEVKAEILADLKRQKSAAKYADMAKSFSDIVYEKADSLKPVADQLHLKVETATNLARTPNPAFGDAPFNNAKFLKAVFTDEVLKNKHNTEAVEIAPSTLMAGHVAEYKPASKRPLAEVDAMIRQRVTLDEALKLAKKAGEAKLADMKKSGDATGFGDVKVVSRSKPEPALNALASKEVLRADVSKLPAYVSLEVPGLGYGIYRIGKVAAPAQIDPARRASDQSQLGGAIGQQEMYAYLEALKQKAKVKILKKLDGVGDAKGSEDK
ncbi:MAG: SurA N-terminal domain-containing protein [Pseudomonadota bacterium]